MDVTELRIRRELAALLGEPAFARLDQALGEPNLFAILSTDEPSASVNAFLAWLLNPNAGHGLEDAFLRAFLVEAISQPVAPADASTEGVSPIPYAAVAEKLLSWDLMDVRCADLRETNVTTDFRLSAVDTRVDICLWNDSYGFAIYVENRLAPKDAWRRGASDHDHPWEHRTEEYLLDLYHQWALPEAGDYRIMQVFMGLDESPPETARLVHPIGYAWMHDVLEKLQRKPTASEHVRLLLGDFQRFLRREIPLQLDPTGLYQDLTSLAQTYGFVISRLYDHVSECMGCDEADETDETAAFHDVYRRHRPVIDALWRAVLQQDDDRVQAVCAEVEQLLTEEDGVILLLLPNRLVATSPRWAVAGAAGGQAGMEVYASTTGASSGIMIRSRFLGANVDRIWHQATDLAEARGEALCPRRHAKLDLHLARSLYGEFDPSHAAADFVRYCRFLNTIFAS